MCDQCPYTTFADVYLAVHKRKHKKNPEKENTCPDCNVEFKFKGLLQYHVCDPGIAPTKFQCPKCEYVHTQRYFS